MHWWGIFQHLRPRNRRTTNRPAPGIQHIDDADIAIMNFHNLSFLDWADMTNTQRARYRDAAYRAVGL